MGKQGVMPLFGQQFMLGGLFHLQQGMSFQGDTGFGTRVSTRCSKRCWCLCWTPQSFCALAPLVHLRSCGLSQTVFHLRDLLHRCHLQPKMDGSVRLSNSLLFGEGDGTPTRLRPGPLPPPPPTTPTLPPRSHPNNERTNPPLHLSPQNQST